ncbi:hypothetical protein INR49_004130 [Caranx melampygus]|nr:hypothetical protein INR49_004130 [Caranx melampygus]
MSQQQQQQCCGVNVLSLCRILVSMLQPTGNTVIIGQPTSTLGPDGPDGQPQPIPMPMPMPPPEPQAPTSAEPAGRRTPGDVTRVEMTLTEWMSLNKQKQQPFESSFRSSHIQPLPETHRPRDQPARPPAPPCPLHLHPLQHLPGGHLEAVSRLHGPHVWRRVHVH